MLLTPPGASAIAVVRISGEGVARFLAARFSRSVAPLRCVHGELRDESGAVIDDPVVVLHEGGAAADINLHGGAWVVSSAVALLQRDGFEIVASSDSLSDGATTIEREMLAALLDAKTEAGVRMLLAQPAAWSAWIASSPAANAIEAVLRDRCLDRLLHPAKVAIVGAPNVGKSTLANQLFGQKRSITADEPGTTRDWVGEIAHIDGLPVTLVDTPGVRQTSDPIEHQAIERSRDVVAGADLVIHVIAPLFTPEPQLIGVDYEHGNGTATITVLNKYDLLRRRGLETGSDALKIVATSGEGVQHLRDLIRKQLGCLDLSPNRPRCWTDRQRELLRDALRDPGTIVTLPK